MPTYSKGPATEAALLTPTGRGAVATVGIRGPGVFAALETTFQPASGKSLGTAPIGRVLFGRFLSVGGTGEEVVLCRTGEADVEIHCHGGQAAAAAILQALAAAGVNCITPREWLTVEVPDLIQVEAIESLARATTERTAAILLDQYRGALRREVEEIASELAASSPGGGKENARLSRLAARAPLGLHLSMPFRIVLAGQPNVGKSSLINRLCGYQRAIVSPQPGTTRDVVTATTAFAGWPVELADTAGLRETLDAIEAVGVERAAQQLAAADLVLLVIDHTAGWTPADTRWLANARLSLVVYNKADLPGSQHDDRPPGVLVSARTGEGLNELERAIADRLGLDSIGPGEGVPFTERQARWLELAVSPTRPGGLTVVHCLQQLLNNPLFPSG